MSDNIQPLTEKDGESKDLIAQNIEKLKQLFPEIVTDGKVDFETLQEVLGDFKEDSQERYTFNWNGKSKARKLAMTSSRGTLRPAPDESLNWDNTENLFIEGDNLEVLKLLQRSYHSKIKMIYIDPPYNTGSDFVYEDDYKDSIKKYKAYTNQVDGTGKDFSSNPETSGRYHTDWLNMIYPRLKLAREVLKNEGVIVIHIDENEYANLEKLLKEIFGEENHLGTIIWDKRNPKGEVAGVAQQHEYICVFCKDKEFFKDRCELKRPKENANKIITKANILIRKNNGVSDGVRKQFKKWVLKQDFSGGEKAYNLIDDEGKVYRPVSMAAPDKPETRSHRPLIHPITGNPCPVPEKGWRFPDKSMDKLITNDEILFGEDETTQPTRKYLLEENLYENVPSLLYYGGSDDALSLPFDNPKPVSIARKLIQSVCNDNDIVLDFFAGSSTSAHAVLELNAVEDTSLRYMMVQIPEACKKNSKAEKEGFNNIAEISRTRIKKAIELIGEEYQDFDGDKGFKVFKLDTSNLKPWDPSFDELQLSIEDSIENIKPGRSEQDVLYEILLKYGLDLSIHIEEKKIAGSKVFVAGTGALFICLAPNIDLDVVEGISKLKEELEPELTRVVFRDSGFKDDVVKTNAVQILKQHGIEDVRSI